MFYSFPSSEWFAFFHLIHLGALTNPIFTVAPLPLFSAHHLSSSPLQQYPSPSKCSLCSNSCCPTRGLHVVYQKCWFFHLNTVLPSLLIQLAGPMETVFSRLSLKAPLEFCYLVAQSFPIHLQLTPMIRHITHFSSIYHPPAKMVPSPALDSTSLLSSSNGTVTCL